MQSLTGLGMGVYAPRTHQRIIRKILLGLAWKYENRDTDLEPLPEMSLKFEAGGKAPDILLYDEKKSTFPLFIEVTNDTGFNSDSKKMQEMIAMGYGTIEGIVYDYTKNRWAKFNKNGDPVKTKPYYSSTVKVDLRKFLEFR